MTKPLSPTQAQILSAAAQHPDRLAEPPAGLPAAACNAVFGSLLRAGLLEEVLASEERGMALRITPAGLEAVGAEPGLPEAAGEAATSLQEGRVGQESTAALPSAQDAPASPAALQQTPTTLHSAAADLLVAWDTGKDALN